MSNFIIKATLTIHFYNPAKDCIISRTELILAMITITVPKILKLNELIDAALGSLFNKWAVAIAPQLIPRETPLVT